MSRFFSKKTEDRGPKTEKQQTSVLGHLSSVVRVGCPAHNCGGRCLLIAHVEKGRIIFLMGCDCSDGLAAP